jgi:hypothetical protein
LVHIRVGLTAGWGGGEWGELSSVLVISPEFFVLHSPGAGALPCVAPQFAQDGPVGPGSAPSVGNLALLCSSLVFGSS